MSEDRRELSLVAGVGQPVPAEGAFAAVGDFGAEAFNVAEEGCAVSRFVVVSCRRGR